MHFTINNKGSDDISENRLGKAPYMQIYLCRFLNASDKGPDGQKTTKNETKVFPHCRRSQRFIALILVATSCKPYV